MTVYWAGSPNYNGGNSGRLFLFPHWTAGGFDGSVATLQNPAHQASAHYVIEGDKVAQLVDEGNTTWHCGNSWYNWRSISYEMVGWLGNPPSYSTLDITAGLMAQASRDYFNGAKLVLGENVMLHRMVLATACPGESDIAYLINKANEYLGGEFVPPAPPPAPPSGEGFQEGTYICQVNELFIRSSPGLSGDIVGSYGYGQSVNLDSWFTSADGYIWGRYTAYSGATRYIAVGLDTGKPESNDYLILQGSAPAAPAAPSSGIEARSYTVLADVLNVRRAASTSSEIVASYSYGQTVNLDGWYGEADGYKWGRYTGYSGNWCFVSLGPVDGSQVYLG